jgi:sugar transferase (PEP-CTERM/EpsH1 system associated)
MRIFITSSRVPYPLEKGDKLRIYHQVKELSKNNDVFLCCLQVGKVHPKAKDELMKICQHVEFIKLNKLTIFLNLFLNLFSSKPFQVAYFYQRKAQNKIDSFIKTFKPERIYAQLIRTSEYVKMQHHVPKTIDYMDSFSLGMSRRSENAAFIFRPILRSEAKRLLHYENIIFDYFENHVIISEQDKVQIWHKDRKKIHVIPNGLDSNFFHPKTKEKKYDLLFSGNMSYIPNIDSAYFLAKEIFPLVQNKIPSCKLLIAGATPHAKIMALQSDFIQVSGWMDDIRDAYWDARIFVAPLRLGSGLQNKLLEAMATKMPSITSDIANNALGAQVSVEILIASSAQEFADSIVTLLENKTKADSIAERGFNYVTTSFNWTKTTSELEAIIKS